MKSSIARLSMFLCILCVVALFILLSGTLSFLPVFQKYSQVWKGYYTLLVPDAGGLTPSGIAEIVTDAGFPEPLYAGSSMVSFRESLDTFGTLPVSEISSRFDELDPRYDDFMRRMSGYFTASRGGRNWHVFYIPASKHPLVFLSSLRPALREAVNGEAKDIRLAEYNVVMKLVYAAAFALFVLLVILLIRFKPLLLVLGSIPFIIVLLNGNVFILAACGILYYCWARLMLQIMPWLKQVLYTGYRDNQNDIVERQIIICSAGMLITTITVSVALKSILPGLLLFLSFLTDLFVLLGVGLLYLVKKSRFEHQPFFYQPLRRVKEKLEFTWSKDMLLVGILVFFLLFPLFNLISPVRGMPAIPQPDPVPGLSGMSRDAIEKLHYYSGNGLPNLYDYMCHAAYQDGYYYGGRYVYPGAGTGVMVTAYRHEGNALKQEQKPVVSFNDEWYRARLAGLQTEKSMMNLLYSLRNPSVVSVRNITPPAINLFYIIIHCLTGIFFFSHVIFVRNPLTAGSLYGIKDFVQRRKREAA